MRHPSSTSITCFGLVAAALAFSPLAKADPEVQPGWDLLTISANLPPPEGQYVSAAEWYAYFGMGIYIKDVIHSGFTQSFAPPPPGGSDTHTFGSAVTGLFSIDGGLTYQSFSASGLTTVRIDSGVDSGNIRNFNTEMLQLDISGGTLPAGLMLRESPTLASTGLTSVADFGDGTYGIDSFFDVYPELSLDGGINWFPDLTPPAHMTLSPEPSSFALLGLGASLAVAANIRRARQSRRS
jgi:hypothetical protein